MFPSVRVFSNELALHIRWYTDSMLFVTGMEAPLAPKIGAVCETSLCRECLACIWSLVYDSSLSATPQLPMFQHVLSLILLSILFFCRHFPGPCLPGPATPDFKDQPTCFLWLKLSASQSPGRPLAPEVPVRTCRGHVVLGPLCLLAASVPGELLGETYHF